ncbi:MAG: D-alanyl-D-alanine carboxypeptidase/D-alanyl-D-alanine-endopeptidase [Limimaricola sp.]|uniref:D-alanyl-D-alanine carboxypeptidase/D-alanyl-D-alanine endopeptidase n=1 Tax=Limimaricola sp. TaxID=2211665 RepID=UPI001D2ACE26|nr:D-alanyl-D-alanine carboxypeptidase/D-alanyl-D-alanine-endopeptidase [Limimaricola sp.]MBI1415810.1 D-alanyl-D-alanine carboxypeptidase/D-alanyl-D-alanine-endopeptidase [Limimaricola sp.]
MAGMLTRRAALAGLLATAAGAAAPVWADAPLRSIRPRARDPVYGAPALGPDIAQAVAAAGLAGKVGVMLEGLGTGGTLGSLDPDTARPPASVAKTVTTLYALDALGAAARFATTLIATGPVEGGVLQGDLILAGGGDPTLNTDDLAAMAADLKAAGVRQVRGRFGYWEGALPARAAIDDGQLPQLSYNPALSGLNLNFNRVYFSWNRSGSRFALTLDARSDRLRPQVNMARIDVVDAGWPPYTYRQEGGVERWTIARASLSNSGGRWLPVREPGAYAADVFRTLAHAQGITLGAPVSMRNRPQGTALVTHQSAPLTQILHDMLKYSTNVTAELVGLSASVARNGRIGSTEESAAAMTAWLASALGVSAHFVDHSGLGAASRISPSGMVAVLSGQGVADKLTPLLKPITLLDERGRALSQQPARVLAKTGTLNYVSNLAGYMQTSRGKSMAFAIFSADMQARAALGESDNEVPPGVRSWTGRARRLEQTLLRGWSAL